MRKGLRTALVIAACIGAAVIAWIFWPPPPAKLVVSRRTTFHTEPVLPDGTVDYRAHVEEMLGAPPAPEENAAIPLIRAAGPACLPDETRAAVLEALGIGAPPDPWPPEGQKRLDLLVEASRKGRFRIPLVSPSRPERLHDAAIFQWSPVADIAKDLVERARIAIAVGDSQGAWSDLLAASRIGRLACQDRTVIGRMVGRSLQVKATDAALVMLRTARLDGGAARAMLADLSALPPGLRPADLLRIERLTFLEITAIAFVAGVENPLRWKDYDRSVFDPSVCLELQNSWSDRYEEAWSGEGAIASRLPRLAALDLEVEGAVKEARELLGSGWKKMFVLLEGPASRRAAMSRSLTQILYAKTLMTISQTLLEFPTEPDPRDRLLAAGLALVARKAERGSYPDALVELVPDPLPAVPPDPWTDKPLLYARRGNGCLVWSVGRDGKDDGGDEKKDIALRLE